MDKTYCEVSLENQCVTFTKILGDALRAEEELEEGDTISYSC